MVLTSLHQDPAQSLSIILTTVTDVMGFLSFLGLATIFAGFWSADEIDERLHNLMQHDYHRVRRSADDRAVSNRMDFLCLGISSVNLTMRRSDLYA